MEVEFLIPVEPKVDEVTIYHDETKEACGRSVWGHGLLFVPKTIEASLLEELESARKNTRCKSKLHFSEISEKVCSRKYKCTKEWIRIGVKYLETNKGCKLGVIFFDKNATNLDLYSGDKKERELRLVETVLRMVLKGCVHYLYNRDWKVKVQRLITDGNPWHRKLDESRVIHRLLGKVRDYVEISPEAEVVSVMSNHKDIGCDDPRRAQALLLQLTDLLLGSVIQSCLRDLSLQSKKGKIIRPVKEVLDKRKRGHNFKHSSHYKSFSLTYATVVNGDWNFKPLNTRKSNISDGQLNLFV